MFYQDPLAWWRDMSERTLFNFYRCTVKRILTGLITAWFGNLFPFPLLSALNLSEGPRKCFYNWDFVSSTESMSNNLEDCCSIPSCKRNKKLTLATQTSATTFSIIKIQQMFYHAICFWLTYFARISSTLTISGLTQKQYSEFQP